MRFCSCRRVAVAPSVSSAADDAQHRAWTEYPPQYGVRGAKCAASARTYCGVCAHKDFGAKGVAFLFCHRAAAATGHETFLHTNFLLSVFTLYLFSTFLS